MPYAKIESSGCEVWHGLVKIRFDLFLKPEDKRYDARYVLVPIVPQEGYPGKYIPNTHQPVDMDDYNAWRASLPKVWQLNPFHIHFLRFEPGVSQDEVLAAINHHIPNFYAAWLQEFDKLPGGMRKGWDVATRQRPRRYDQEMSLQELQVRSPQCFEKLNLIVASNLSVVSKDIGEIFPATIIDIGAGATDRLTSLTGYTAIDQANAANDTGTIDTWELWFEGVTTGVKVGTFYGSGLNYTKRDSELIGNVASGSKQTFTGLSTTVATGDFAGYWAVTGSIQLDNSGQVGMWYKAGDQFEAGTVEYASIAGYALSIYGTGETAGVFYTKVVTETLWLFDTEVDLRQLFRTIAETLYLNEVFSRLKGIVKTATETLGIIEAINRARSFVKLISETLELNEGLVKAKGFIKTIAENLHLIEAASFLKGTLKIIGETLELAEAKNTAIGWAKVIAETLYLNEGINKAHNFIKFIAETVETIETQIKSLAMVRWVSETVGIAESKVRGFTRAISESIEIIESKLHLRQLNRIITETQWLNETVNKARNFSKAIAETLEVTEGIVRAKAFLIRIGESLEITEAIAKARDLIKAITETLHIVEAISRARNFIKVISDTVELAEEFLNRAIFYWAKIVSVTLWPRVVGFTLRTRDVTMTLWRRAFSLKLRIR